MKTLRARPRSAAARFTECAVSGVKDFFMTKRSL
jgi:hypothetical protein